MRLAPTLLLPLSSFLLLAIPLSAADVQLETAGAAYAPMDPKKARDASVSSSAGDREDAVKEFKGLMSMALNKVSHTQWQGRSIADCEQRTGSGAEWCAKCEIIMPHANGFYYFFPEGAGCTLQQFDAHVHVPDPSILPELRAPLQRYFGRGNVVTHGVSKGIAGRHWDTGSDFADLLLDHSGEPYIRFVWSRAPLIHTNPTFNRRFVSSLYFPRTDN